MTQLASGTRRGTAIPGRVVSRSVIVVLYLFLLAPLIVVTILSFNSGNSLAFPLEGFSLGGYVDLFQNKLFMRGLQVSAVTAAVSTGLVLAAGVPAALAIHRHEFRGKAVVSALFLTPLLIPAIVLGLGLLLVFAPLDLTGTYHGIVLAHFPLTIPYVVRTTLMSLSTADTSCEEAASILGAGPWTVFWRVTLPIIVPGVVAGGVIAFLTSFDEAVLSLFVAGSGKTTLPVEMFRYVQNRTDPQIAALSVVLIVFSLLVVVLIERFMGLRKVLDSK